MHVTGDENSGARGGCGAAARRVRSGDNLVIPVVPVPRAHGLAVPALRIAAREARVLLGAPARFALNPLTIAGLAVWLVARADDRILLQRARGRAARSPDERQHGTEHRILLVKCDDPVQRTFR